MEIKEFIASELAKRRDVYSNNANIILEDYRREREKIDEYNGRQLLEMLQNADDAAVTDKDKVCLIELKNNELIIANNGERFSKEGIESLMYSSLSPKVNEQNKIGQKGLGFRSILSWAEKVLIKSYDFAIEFSEENSKNFLKDLIKENPELKRELSEKERNIEFPIATLRCPRILAKLPADLDIYDTYIVVELKDEAALSIQKQINTEIDKEVLLFLNNLEKIVIESPERQVELTKKSKDNHQIMVSETNKLDSSYAEKKWNILSRNDAIRIKKNEAFESKNYELKVAWTEDLDDVKDVLYSYFKTDVQIPFPGLIHGTFELTSDRNHLIPESEYNKLLMIELIQLLIDASLSISKGEVSFKPLQLLSFKGFEKYRFDKFFNENEFLPTLKSKVRESNIYPTISGKYISYSEYPIYFKNDFTEILPDDKFPKILIHTDDNDIEEVINWFGYCKPDYETFFPLISEVSVNFTVEERAKLIVYLSDEFKYEDIPKEQLPSIFIDQSGELIKDSSEMFFPSSSSKLKLPSELKLKFVNKELLKQIEKITQIQNLNTLQDRLALFKVNTYSFRYLYNELLKALRAKYPEEHQEIKSTKGIIKELFNFYSNNKDFSEIGEKAPTNKIINLINRKGETVPANKIYLGKDYDNELGENLFQSNEEKLVASIQSLGLDDVGYEKDFLTWLGVKKYPETEMVSLSGEDLYGYFDFALKQYPFEQRNIYWRAPEIDSYVKVKREGVNQKEAKVESIPGLENILMNNSLETIISWIYLDRELFAINERKNESFISFGMGQKRHDIEIRQSEMPSYLLWKISKTEWIRSSDNTLIAPETCCLSKTITDDFSPDIEKPIINYEHPLLIKEKISSEAVDEILLKMGMKKDISKFSTGMIYSILDDLESVDPEGERAEAIYKELAENFKTTNLDKENYKYSSFSNYGKVFCKKGNSKSYQSVKEVYYVDDNYYGEELVNNFYTLLLDPRKGTRKVEYLFGVKPLRDLEVSLIQEPNFHERNKEFINEIENLKPFIYSLWISKDQDEKILKQVKNIKISVCTNIQPAFKTKDENSTDPVAYELKPYEFVKPKNSDTYFILLDSNKEYKDIKGIKSDFKLAGTVQEIFGSILEEKGNNTIISNLFESIREKREYLLNNELGDSFSDILKASNEKLNIVEDPKLKFWFSVLRALRKEFVKKVYDENELYDLVNGSLDIDIDDFNINYLNLQDEATIPELIALFKNLGIDISSFNEASTLSIDLMPYYSKGIKQLRLDRVEQFKNLLFEQLVNEQSVEKENYLDIIEEYEGFEIEALPNSVYVDLPKIFNDAIIKRFGVDLVNATKVDNAIRIYNKNFEDLKNHLQGPEFNIELLKEIINANKKFRSLIYFSEFDELISQYSQESDDMKVNQEMPGTELSDFESVNLARPVPIEKIRVTKDEANSKVVIKSPSLKKSSIRSIGDKEEKGDIGEKGERLVFEALKEKYGIDNVAWESNYAKQAGVNPTGGDQKHYDLRYKDKSGDWRYVEVKTTKGDRLEFKITEPEKEFGLEHASSYDIYIVLGINDETTRIKIIEKIFEFGENESFYDNNKFSVKSDSYTIKFEVEAD